jgi:hypothetical protein
MQNITEHYRLVDLLEAQELGELLGLLVLGLVILIVNLLDLVIFALLDFLLFSILVLNFLWYQSARG